MDNRLHSFIFYSLRNAIFALLVGALGCATQQLEITISTSAPFDTTGQIVMNAMEPITANLYSLGMAIMPVTPDYSMFVRL